MTLFESLKVQLRRIPRAGSTTMRWLRANRANQVATAACLLILVASSVWFFAARDDRGPTARLTADAWYYHAYLPSLVFDQDLDFRDEFKVTKNWYRLGKTPTGRQANVFGIGPALSELPFFLAGHAVASLSGANSNGFSKTEVRFTLFASLLFSLGAIVFGARLVSRRLGGRYGPAAIAFLAALGGPVVYYAIRQPGYAHPFATFWTAWLLDYWDKSFDHDRRVPRDQRFWIGLGLLIGAASLARPQLVLWAILGAYAAASDITVARSAGFDRRAMAKLVRYWCVGALCALLVVLPQLFAWKALYGSFLASPQGEGFMRWGDSAWLETLMSSRNGLFPWAPIYALGCIGIIYGLRRHVRLCSALFLGILLQAYANGAAWDWWGGGAFGGRRFDSCYIAFAFGLAVLILPAWKTAVLRVAPIRKTGAALIAVLAASLAVVNVDFASSQSAPTVRIYGGEPASRFLKKHGGPLGPVAAWASSMSNLPARASFAWRNDATLAAYDRVVGVHQLGELFPGLNSFRGKKKEVVSLSPAHPRVRGLTRQGNTLVSPSGKVRLLIGLNRLGPVEIAIDLVGDSPTVSLNGKQLVTTPDERQPNRFRVRIDHYNRGSNRLAIESSVGFILRRVELTTSVNAAGHKPAPKERAP